MKMLIDAVADIHGKQGRNEAVVKSVVANSPVLSREINLNSFMHKVMQ
jgi:hypothetical protein